jgi:ATP-dependent helicase HrpB
MKRIPLPVDGVVDRLKRTLADHATVVLTAPPGSGKTTRVPPAVAEVVDGRVLLLQPRRVAARSCAARIAAEQGTEVGANVGHWVRFDKRFGADTKIVVLTEGLLTRMLQSDPFLEGIGAVILDEFHERSLHSDLALAMLAEVVREARPDLKLVVMSATLDAEPVIEFLGGPAACPTLHAEGRRFDVELEHRGMGSDVRLETAVSSAIRNAIRDDPKGHVLAFLPGVGEIERVSRALEGIPGVLPLHGRLPPAQQDKAIRPSPTQKIVLATNIAETSLTIDGVTTVVDSGLARRPRFDPRLGFERLETVPISVASADQRAGRAGRTRAGRCIRLWSRAEHALRPAHDASEVATADLASTALDLCAWGSHPNRFQWFESPPASAIDYSLKLLVQLGAVHNGTITSVGKEIARLPLHPRLATVVREGAALGVLSQAAAAAALASERDPWSDQSGADLLTRLDWLHSRSRTGANPRALAAVKRIRDDLVRIGKRFPGGDQRDSRSADEATLRALLAGFPDRVGRKRAKDGRAVLLANGSGVDLAHGVDCGEWLIALTLTAGSRGRTPLIRAAAALDPSLLACEWEDECVFDREREAVAQRRVRRWGSIVLAEKPSGSRASAEAVAAVLHDAAMSRSERVFPETGEYGRTLSRLRFAARVAPNEAWPSWIDEPLQLADQWCIGRRSLAELAKMDLAADLIGRLPYALRTRLDRLAPERMRVPSGSMIRLDYPEGKSPVLAARVQQLFGMMQTPALGGEPITVHLLAPNNRPAQVTQDLASFWTNTYADVRKDLRGRYPKHAWPEDPSQAIPENRPKRRR